MIRRPSRSTLFPTRRSSDLITSNGKGRSENKPVPLKGTPPLALDLGVRTDPEARALRRGERLYSSKRRRSEEHTSELQSLRHLVCRLLLEKKKKNITTRRVT